MSGREVAGTRRESTDLTGGTGAILVVRSMSLRYGFHSVTTRIVVKDMAAQLGRWDGVL
jgi:hypothetical protein